MDGRYSRVVVEVTGNGRLLSATPLLGGSSARTTALRVVTREGEEHHLILREPSPAGLARRPHRLANQFSVLQQLATAGLPVPQPLALGAPQPDFPQGFLLMSQLAGAALYSQAGAERRAFAAGRQLARLHQLPLTPELQQLLPEAAQQISWILDHPPSQLDASLQEEVIRSRLKEMGAKLPKNPRLLHGDYWPGNWLWQADELVGVIDWEDARWGDPLSDLAIARLDCRMLFGEGAQRALMAGYETETAVDPTRLPFWDLAAALRPAGQISAWAADWPALGRPDLTPGTMRRAHNAFVVEALAGYRE